MSYSYSVMLLCLNNLLGCNTTNYKAVIIPILSPDQKLAEPVNTDRRGLSWASNVVSMPSTTVVCLCFLVAQIVSVL